MAFKKTTKNIKSNDGKKSDPLRTITPKLLSIGTQKITDTYFWKQYQWENQEHIESVLGDCKGNKKCEKIQLQEIFEDAIKEYNETVEMFTGFPQTFKVYRSVNVNLDNLLDFINKDIPIKYKEKGLKGLEFELERAGLGEYWSFTRDFPEVFERKESGGEGATQIILEGIVDKKDVNWFTTIMQNINFIDRGEDEINIKEKSTIKLLTITDVYEKKTISINKMVKT